MGAIFASLFPLSFGLSPSFPSRISVLIFSPVPFLFRACMIDKERARKKYWIVFFFRWISDRSTIPHSIHVCVCMYTFGGSGDRRVVGTWFRSTISLQRSSSGRKRRDNPGKGNAAESPGCRWYCGANAAAAARLPGGAAALVRRRCRISVRRSCRRF